MCLVGLTLLVGVAYMSYDYDYQKEGYNYDYQYRIEDTWNFNTDSTYDYNCTTYTFSNCPKKTLQCQRPLKDCGCKKCKGCKECKGCKICKDCKICNGCIDVSCLKKTPECQIKGEPGKLCTLASYTIY